MPRTHGMYKHPLYGTWKNIIQRCENQDIPCWPDYGGRGIAICDRWRRSFPDFLADVGERPSDPLGWSSRAPYWTLDRIDNNGNYEPGNVRWATQAEQVANSRSREIDLDVRQLIELYDQGIGIDTIGKRLGYRRSTVWRRLKDAGVNTGRRYRPAGTRE